MIGGSFLQIVDVDVIGDMFFEIVEIFDVVFLNLIGVVFDVVVGIGMIFDNDDVFMFMVSLGSVIEGDFGMMFMSFDWIFSVFVGFDVFFC